MAEYFGNQPTTELYLMLSKLAPSFSDEKLDSLRDGFMQIEQFPEDPQFAQGLPISPSGATNRLVQNPFAPINLPSPPDAPDFESLSLSSIESLPPFGACCYQNDDGEFFCGQYFQEDCINLEGEWHEEQLCVDIECNAEEDDEEEEDEQVGACCIGGVCNMLPKQDCLDLEGEWIGPDTNCIDEDCGPDLPDDDLITDNDGDDYDDDDDEDDPDAVTDDGSAWTGDEGCHGCNTPLDSADLSFSPGRFSNFVFSNIRHYATWKVYVDVMARPPIQSMVYPDIPQVPPDLRGTPLPIGTRVSMTKRKYKGNIGTVHGAIFDQSISLGSGNFSAGGRGFFPDCACDGSVEDTVEYIGDLTNVTGPDGSIGVGFSSEKRATIASKSVTAFYDLAPSSCNYGSASCPECFPYPNYPFYKPCAWHPTTNDGTPVESDIIDVSVGQLSQFIYDNLGAGSNSYNLPYSKVFTSQDLYTSALDEIRDKFAQARDHGPNDPSTDPCPTAMCWDQLAITHISQYFDTDNYSLPKIGGTGNYQFAPDVSYALPAAVSNLFCRSCYHHQDYAPASVDCIDQCDPDGDGQDIGEAHCKECLDPVDNPCHPDNTGQVGICPDFSTAGSFWPPVFNDCPTLTNPDGDGCRQLLECAGPPGDTFGCLDCTGSGTDIASAGFFSSNHILDDVSLKLEMTGYFQGGRTFSRRHFWEPDPTSPGQFVISPNACVTNTPDDEDTPVYSPKDYVNVFPTRTPILRWDRSGGPFNADNRYNTLFFGGQAELNCPGVFVATNSCQTYKQFVQEDCDPMHGGYWETVGEDVNGGLWTDYEFNNTAFSDVYNTDNQSGDFLEGILPVISGPWYPAFSFNKFGATETYPNPKTFFRCCLQDKTLPDSTPPGNPSGSFGNTCIESLRDNWEWPNNPNADPLLVGMEIVDYPCDSTDVPAWTPKAYTMPMSLYGGWNERFVFEVPTGNPDEYNTYIGPWLMTGYFIEGNAHSWYVDLVAWYQVTSNYVSLDVGTMPA